MAIAIVIALSGSGVGHNSPSADDSHARCPSGSIPAGAGCIDAKPVFIDKCPGVRKALRFYTKRWQHWTALRTGVGRTASARRTSSCPRYLLKIRKLKAAAAHREWNRYFHYHYAWSEWLPRLWVAIGMCETQLNWAHNSGTYQGAFGFWYGTWDSYKPRGAPSEAYLATPRQQYQAALNVAARVGLGAWGCYSHGGYRYHL